MTTRNIYIVQIDFACREHHQVNKAKWPALERNNPSHNDKAYHVTLYFNLFHFFFTWECDNFFFSLQYEDFFSTCLNVWFVRHPPLLNCYVFLEFIFICHFYNQQILYFLILYIDAVYTWTVYIACFHFLAIIAVVRCNPMIQCVTQFSLTHLLWKNDNNYM